MRGSFCGVHLVGCMREQERDGEGERSRVTFQMCFYGPVKGGVGVRGWGV